MYTNQIEICYPDNNYKRCLLTNGSGKKKIRKIVGLLGFLKKKFPTATFHSKKTFFNGNLTLQFCSSINVILFSNRFLLFRNV